MSYLPGCPFTLPSLLGTNARFSSNTWSDSGILLILYFWTPEEQQSMGSLITDIGPEATTAPCT